MGAGHDPPEDGQAVNRARHGALMPASRIAIATEPLFPPLTEEELRLSEVDCFTDDPYFLKEGVRLVHGDHHDEALRTIRFHLGEYVEEKGLGYRVTSEILETGIPEEHLEDTRFHQGSMAFDIGLYPSPPVPAFKPGHNLGSIPWDEWKEPHLVLEVLSDSTEQADREAKWRVCRSMGVEEFWLFDPKKETGALEGWRLDDEGDYLPIEADSTGVFCSAVLGTRWRGQDYKLEWWDTELNDWYSVRGKGFFEGHAQGLTEGHAQGLREVLIDVAQDYLDAERLDQCRRALQSRTREELPSVRALIQTVRQSDTPASTVESILLGTDAASAARAE